MSKALMLLLTTLVGSRSLLGCSQPGSLAHFDSRLSKPPSTISSSARAASDPDPMAAMPCEPPVALSAAMRLAIAGDKPDLGAIEAIRRAMVAGIEHDARQRDQLIVQQVGEADAPVARLRFRSLWTRYQFRCLLQEAEAECQAEIPDHACAVLVGLYERAIGGHASRDAIDRVMDASCSRGKRSSCLQIGLFYERASRREPLYSARADDVFSRACSRGEPLSCDRLASRSLDRSGNLETVAQWRVRAAQLAEEQCAHGAPQDCFETALRYVEDGAGVPGLRDRVREMFRSACARGHASSCNAIGQCFELGTCSERSLETAAGFYRRACELQDGVGCSALGMLLEAGKGMPRSPRQAVELYGRACELGNANGCNYLCWAKLEGRAVQRNLQQASAACERGCERNDSNSCTLLAWFHHVGAGVERNGARALELGTLACAGGDLAGCSNLGEMLTLAPGLRRDDARARELFSLACAQGSESACANLGLMSELGLMGPADWDRALELYRRAAPARPRGGYRLAADLGNFCSLRDPRACTLLGVLHHHGVGTAKDQARGDFFLGKGCSLGDDWGCAALKSR